MTRSASLTEQPITAEIEIQQRYLHGRVTIIDDDEDILSVLSSLISQEGYVCHTYKSAITYLQTLSSNQPELSGPHCILCDVKMPQMSGLELQASLLNIADTPILIMSGFSGADEASTAFRAGAIDFLIKPIDADVLLAAVKTALAVSKERYEQHMKSSDLAERIISLTEPEADVARLVASGLTNPEIAENLGIALGTVKLHRHNAMEKIGAHGITDLVRIVDESGLNGNLVENSSTGSIKTLHTLTDEQLRIADAIFETNEAIMVTNAAGIILRVNSSFERITGYSPEEIIGQNPSILSSGKHNKKFYAAMWKEIQEVGVWNGEIWDRHKSGNIIPIQLTMTAVKNKAGRITHYVGTFIEISDRKKAEVKLVQTEQRFSTIINSLEVVIWTACAPDFHLHYLSEATEKLYGLPQQDFIDAPELWFKVIHPEDKPRVQAANRKALELDKTEIEYRIIHSDGEQRWLLDRMSVICSTEGKTTDLVGVTYDITERKLVHEKLQQNSQLTKQALDELKYQKFALDKHAILAITDVRGRITYANSMFCEISGYSLDELIGNKHDILNSGYHPKGFFKEMYRTVARGKTWHEEVCNRAKDGHFYWVDTTIAPFMDDKGKPHSYITIRTDITQRKKAEENSSHLAFYDSLTDLPNRRLLLDRLHQALVTSSRSGQRGALLFLDLDHFKTLNDTQGHEAGDLLLQQVTARLTKSVREGDTVARLGGDEFVVLLEDLGENTIEAAARTEAIGEKILHSLHQPYHLDSYIHQCSSSIGATLFDNNPMEKEELLKQADIAMYAAKKAGRNRLRFFDPKMQRAITVRVELEHELRQAIELQQFELHYQIQVDNKGKAIGAEALIRWQHPERGMVSPFHFIPMAEETGLIVPIGNWVLDTACAQLKVWQQDPATSNIQLAVNVSATQFLQTDFVEQVKTALKKYNVNPAGLKLELTESMLVNKLNHIIATMTTLGDIGVKFSLDDFGTGYSSLRYLKTLPLDQLKIDQSFVQDIATDSSDKAIVLTIITMAHSLGLDVIAEGVETTEQQQFLLDNGCKHFQGYLFSKPVPIEAFESLLKSLP